MKYNITEMVRDNQKATFQYYRDSDLWYRTETGFEFPVPIADVGTATFNKEEKALLLMRWIRKHLKVVDDQES